MICKQCEKDKKSNECALCKQKTGKTMPSLTIQNIINSFIIDCESGCGIKIKFGEIDSHQLVCAKTSHRCFGSNCEFIGLKDEFLSHLADKHKEYLIKICVDKN